MQGVEQEFAPWINQVRYFKFDISVSIIIILNRLYACMTNSQL